MIAFGGEFSERAQKLMLKIQFKMMLLPAFLIFVIFTAAVVLICALTELWIIMIFELAVVLTAVLTVAGPYIERKKTLRVSLPKKVVIDGGFVSAVWEDGEMQKPVSDVKKVMKMDGCCYIVFRRPRYRDVFCEAACMTAGTLEAFERLFQGKIEEHK